MDALTGSAPLAAATHGGSGLADALAFSRLLLRPAGWPRGLAAPTLQW